MTASGAGGLGFNLIMHEDFLSDLQELEEQPGGPDLADDIFVYVQELEYSPDQLHNLLTDKLVFKTGSAKEFEVKLLKGTVRQFPGTWRLRLLDDDVAFGNYRIIYVYGPKNRTFYVLGLMHREIDYDYRHPLFDRIFSRYRELDI